MTNLGEIEIDSSDKTKFFHPFSAADKLENEMWNEHFYHAAYDIEWGSPPSIMTDIMLPQVWANTVGLSIFQSERKEKC